MSNHSQATFKFFNRDINRSIIGAVDPKNWEKSQRTLKRSMTTFGLFTEATKELEFTKQTASFLRESYLYRDIEADCYMEEYRDYPDRDGQYLYSSSDFDFSEYEKHKNIVKVPFKTGGLTTLIESQYDTKFELQRLTSIKGDVLEPLNLVDIALQSRKIFLLSGWELAYEDETMEGTDFGTSFDFAGATRTPLLNIVSNSDAANITGVYTEFVPWDNPIVNGDDVHPEADQFFYTASDVAKTVELNLSTIIKLSSLNGTSCQMWILQRDEFDATVEFRNVYEQLYTADKFEHDINVHESFDLSAGDSLALIVSMTGGTAGNNFTIYRSRFTDFSMSLAEDSAREDSATIAVLWHEIGDRLMQIITGEKGRYYSETVGRIDLGYEQDGPNAYAALTMGLWIRQFFDKNIELSIKQFFEASMMIMGMSYTIENRNGVDVFVHEDLKYFFQEFTSITIPNRVSKMVRKPAKELYTASSSWGYTEGGEYEEAMGLDEFNTQTDYTHPITKVDKQLKNQAPIRNDSYAKEFARRKPKLNFPEQDTRYDKDAFFLFCKVGQGLALEERIWSDAYEELPTGVYSPETATGLDHTPFRNMERLMWFYGAAFRIFENDYIRFSNSYGNSELSTKKAGEVARAENGDILVSDLEYPRVKFQWIEFEHEVDFALSEQIYGSTDIAGRDVPNYFGRVKFINDEGQIEYGYLFQVEPNDEGKWKLLKAL